jgi:hypothetical protein
VGEGHLYLFLSPTDRDLDLLAGEARRILEGLRKRNVDAELRLVLLVADFNSMGSLHRSEAFFSFVKDLRDLRGPGFELRLYDEEGLAWAERLRIERTPAWALVRDSRAHLVYGSRARIEEVTTCNGR